MINHVVLFKLKDFAVEEKIEIMKSLKSALEDLNDKIKEIKYLEVGLNFKPGSPDYDIVLLSHFENESDLEIYRTHPEHLKVVAMFADVTESRAAVDYKF